MVKDLFKFLLSIPSFLEMVGIVTYNILSIQIQITFM